KDKLSIDKVSRDKQKGVEDVADYVKNLIVRARHFGYKRNEEFFEIINDWQELRGTIQLYQNCDEQERKELKVTPEDIIDKFINYYYPRYDEIDRKFRNEMPANAEEWEKPSLEGGQRA